MVGHFVATATLMLGLLWSVRIHGLAAPGGPIAYVHTCLSEVTAWVYAHGASSSPCAPLCALHPALPSRRRRCHRCPAPRRQPGWSTCAPSCPTRSSTF